MNITTVKKTAFSGCSSLKTVYFATESQKDQFKYFFNSNVELVVK
jgi:hypothetical protein